MFWKRYESGVTCVLSSKVNRAKRRMNPFPYVARYFGEKVHIDQNEKLVRYGVTHICCVDGYSGKIVGFVTMPVKNNIEIYEHVFRYYTAMKTLISVTFTDHCFLNMGSRTKFVWTMGMNAVCPRTIV